MKTVKDYLDLGLVFVGGDKLRSSANNKDDKEVCMSGLCIAHQRYCEGFRGGNAIFFYPSEWTPSSFAWRNNDLVKPEYKGLIDAVLNSGWKVRLFVSELLWMRGFCKSVAKWRPVVLQSESPTVSPKEDKPMKQFKTNQEANEIVAAHIDSMKPVYTAEMHAKGELPQVGAECILIVNDEPRPAKVTYIGKDIVCCSNVDGDAEYSCLLGLVSFQPIPKTINVNGFDVPEPMSEAPERGSEYFIPMLTHDTLCDDYTWQGNHFDVKCLHKGICHSEISSAIAHAKAMLGIDPNA